MKKKNKIELDIIIAVLVIFSLLSIGTVYFHFSEHLSWLNSLYFTTMTVVTVGYGDFTPTKDITRVFTIIFSLISIPAILFCLGLIIEDFLKQKINKIETEVNRVITEEKELKKIENQVSQVLEKEEKIIEREEKILSQK